MDRNFQLFLIGNFISPVDNLYEGPEKKPYI